MAAKKYLSLEEAAALIGVRADEVMRMREKGELRGFADRGTWKFKSDDVTEAKRRRQPDSSPDVSLISEDDEDSILSEPPGRERNTSDSDVRLILQDDLKSQLTGSSGDVPVFSPKKGSDSDVRLVGSSSGIKKGSDSDVQLIKSQSAGRSKPTDSDSDVRLSAPAGKSPSDSDSDVRLASPPGSDSDVKLVKHGSGDSIFSGGDDVLGSDFSDSVLLDDDSGIALHSDSDRRPGGDSGVRLSSESGIQLRRPQDSGILLEGSGSFKLSDDDDDVAFKLADDSGIKVGGDAPKSTSRMREKAPSTDSDIESSSPVLMDADNDDLDRTDPEVPLLMSDDDDDIMPKGFNLGDETQAETNVILFDDEDDADEDAATMVRRKSQGGMSSKELETVAFEMDSDDVIDEEILEASDDSFADGEMEEVFAEDDTDFSDSFSDEGMSEAEIATSRAAFAPPPTSEWSGGVVMLLACSSLCMICGAWMATDLLSTVFASGTPVYQGPFVEAIGGLFK